MKLTPWFPGTVKPVRRGVYRTEWLGEGDDGGFSYWSGRYWGLEMSTVGEAAMLSITRGNQQKSWRGLASDPSKG